MKYILSMIILLVLISNVSAQRTVHRYQFFTPTTHMRIDQIERQEHMNRAIPRNWIDIPTYRSPYHHYPQYYYPPLYVPYQQFYNVPVPYRNFNYGVTIYNGNGFYLNYGF
jgi:hypothetical protein